MPAHFWRSNQEPNQPSSSARASIGSSQTHAQARANYQAAALKEEKTSRFKESKKPLKVKPVQAKAKSAVTHRAAVPQSQRVAIKRVDAASASINKARPAAQKQGSSTKKEKKKKHAFAPETKFVVDEPAHYHEHAEMKFGKGFVPIQLTTRSIAKEAVAVVHTPANITAQQFSHFSPNAMVGKKQL